MLRRIDGNDPDWRYPVREPDGNITLPQTWIRPYANVRHADPIGDQPNEEEIP